MTNIIPITLLGLALILQEVQIIMLRKDVDFNNRLRKRMMKWFEIQSVINHSVCEMFVNITCDKKEGETDDNN